MSRQEDGDRFEVYRVAWGAQAAYAIRLVDDSMAPALGINERLALVEAYRAARAEADQAFRAWRHPDGQREGLW